ncbi:MAG TPA: hypothetical protein VN031_03685 [Candidatus Microsaccharimonas sp.]|nr:hypothetical protein [Candidatus Microsaccharimonas sp.]
MISPEFPQNSSGPTSEEPRSLVDEVAELLDTPDDSDRRPARPHEVDAKTKYYMDGVVTIELGPSSESLL